MTKIGIIIPEESGTLQEDAEFLSQKLGIEPVFWALCRCDPDGEADAT